MTFKHKLSRRLALLRGVARVSALLALACITPPGDRLGGPAGSVNRVVIIPDSVVAQPNQEVEFVAVGLTTVGDTANVAVRWSVTDGTITEVGIRAGRAYGRYKPDKPGRHNVEVTDSGGRVDTGVVDVPVPVASVTVTPTSASVMAGQATQLTTTLRDSAGNVLTGRAVGWSSGNAGVATVNASGMVTGASAGSTTITATSEGRNGSAGVTVTLPPVASVSVTPASAGVGVGQAVQLTATPRDASGNALSGRVVTWSTSAAGTATVSASGLVTGVAAGAATITASSEGRTGTASVTVSAPVASVTVTPGSASVQTGATTQLAAVLRDAAGNTMTGQPVSWSSSASAVATVSASGLVTGAATGSATVTATSEGKSGTSTIAVTVAPVASVTVSPASASVTVGGTVQLTATPRDASGNPLTGRVVTWSSSNTGRATVSGSGLVSGVAAGSATITATSEGKSGTSAVTMAGTGSAASLAEDFSTYTSTADLLANPRGIFATVEDINTSRIVLDMTRGYGASSRSMRYDFPDRTGEGGSGTSGRCSSFTVSRSVAFTEVSEVWVEIYVMFSAGFTTLAPAAWGCTSNAEYKFIFGHVFPSANRFNLNKGTFGTNWTWGHPDDEPGVGGTPPGSIYGSQSVSDGQWHQYRLHMKVSTPNGAANGVARFWLDGVLIKEFPNAVINRSTIWGLALGRNMNQGPDHPQSVWWGAIRVWNTSPGW